MVLGVKGLCSREQWRKDCPMKYRGHAEKEMQIHPCVWTEVLVPVKSWMCGCCLLLSLSKEYFTLCIHLQIKFSIPLKCQTSPSLSPCWHGVHLWGAFTQCHTDTALTASCFAKVMQFAHVAGFFWGLVWSELPMPSPQITKVYNAPTETNFHLPTYFLMHLWLLLFKSKSLFLTLMTV